MILVNFLTPIRISPSADVCSAAVDNNYGIKGLEDMLKNLVEKSLYRNQEDGYKFRVVLKIDDDDVEALKWIDESYSEYESYVDYVVSNRIPKSVDPESIHDKTRLHYTHIHYWMQECTDISQKSKYYWLWNHNNQILTDQWDIELYDYNGPLDKVLSPLHSTRFGGMLSPIVPRGLLEDNHELETPICGGSPFDAW